MAITRFAQNIAIEQAPFQNFPGGGITAQGSPASPGFNDPGLEIGDVKEVTCIYQMYGNEVANDIVNLYLAQPGTMVVPLGSICQSGIAATATAQIGDDDTTGFGLVSQTATPLGADPARYANNVNIATGQTNPIAFAGGSALTDPYVIGATATEPIPTGSNPTGAGIAGAWIQLKFQTLATPVAGKVLVIRLRVVKP